MDWTHLIAWFFGGVFVANGIPHFVHGLSGKPFQTPFAKPPAQGLSSATANVLWGWFNLAVGIALLLYVGDFDMRKPADALSAGLGALVLAIGLARQFGRFNGGDLNGSKS